MNITVYNRIELAVNEIFDYQGIKLRVVEDRKRRGCIYCYFRNDNACKLMECREDIREDEANVHFIKANKKVR